MLTSEEAVARKPFAEGNEIEMFGETLGWNDRDLGNFLRYYLNVIVETVRAVQPETEENKINTYDNFRCFRDFLISCRACTGTIYITLSRCV